MARWKLEPTASRLNRFAERAKNIASRLGKDVDIVVESNGLRLCAETWSPVWSVFSHVVRNAVDHGIERPADRVKKGKSRAGRISLRTLIRDGRFLIEVSDDGKGVAWDLVAAKAKAANLPFATKRELVDAVLADGLSTTEEITDLSGRGVGMAAVREACRALGGTVDIESESSGGTTVRCSFPERMMDGHSVASLIARPIAQSLIPMA